VKISRPPCLTPGLLCVGALLLSSALAGVPRLMRARGWDPVVELMGQGDPRLAVRHSRDSLERARVIVHTLHVDEATTAFLSDLRQSLTSFDLEGFHELLPEEDGDWRQVRVFGTRYGSTYRVRRGLPQLSCTIDPGGPVGGAFGDFAGWGRSLPVEVEGERTNYVLHGQVGVGVGRIGPDALERCLVSFARILQSGDPQAPSAVEDPRELPSASTRSQVRRAHPDLTAEDVEVVGLLWEAYPRLARFLASLARAEDVLAGVDERPRDHQHLYLKVRLEPERLGDAYPDLAEFLAGLGPIVNASVRFADPQGREWLHLGLDTEQLSLTVEGRLHDGRLVPTLDGEAVLDAEPGERYTARVDVHGNLNGVRISVREWRFQTGLRELSDGVQWSFRSTQAPAVEVLGSVYGVLPAWAIDVVIPGNMRELIEEFLSVACGGNFGHGLRAFLEVRQAAGGGPGTVSLMGSLELYNSLLVSLVASVAGQKFWPDDDTQDDLRHLLSDGLDAVAADLAAWSAGVR
jgi:hypothetical protein